MSRHCRVWGSPLPVAQSLGKVETGRGRRRGTGLFIIYFLVNVGIVAVELSLVGAAAWLAWKLPVVFAGVTAVLTLLLGLRLEFRRLAFEMPFYFDRSSTTGQIMRALIGGGQALMKGLVAAIVALMTFSGTETARLQIVAAIFGVCVLVGSMLLRRLTISLGARPAHWGFFRMAAPLGLLFSAGMSFFPAPSSLDMVRKVVFDLPARPGIAQAGEALFALRLWIDDLVVRLLVPVAGLEGARVIGIVVGSNVLVGFLVSVYAVIVAEIVRVMEEAGWRLRGFRSKQG